MKHFIFQICKSRQRTRNLFKNLKDIGLDETRRRSFLDRICRDPSLFESRSTDQQGFTLLHAAAEWGNSHAVDTLLNTPSVDTEALLWSVDLQGRTALHVAAAKGNLDVCRQLFLKMSARGAPIGLDAPTCLSGLTPVAYSARETRQALPVKNALKELL